MSIINPALLRMAKQSVHQKTAFTPPPDQSQMGGQDPAAGGVDPSQMAGIGMPGASQAGGGSPPVDQEMIRNMLRQELQQIMPQLQGGGAGGAGGAQMGPGGKPMKLDVGVELHRLNVMLAKIIDELGLQIPASDMVTTEEQAQMPGQQNSQMNGQPGQSPESAIAPVQPIAAAGPAQHQQHHQQHQAEARVSPTARLFIEQGECDAGESILPLSTQASALSHLMDHMPMVEERIA